MNIPITSLTVLAAATSANGTARNSTATFCGNFDPLSCIFLCTSAVTTSSVAATFKLQGSFDGVVYFDLNGLTWSSEAGTGAAVTTRKTLSVPNGIHGLRFVRCVATLAGAATAGADQTTVAVNYNPIGRLFGQAIPT